MSDIGTTPTTKAAKSLRTGKRQSRSARSRSTRFGISRRSVVIASLAAVPLWGCVMATDSTATETLRPSVVLEYEETPEQIWVRGLNDAVRVARAIAKQEGTRTAIGYALTDYLTINPSHLGDRMHSLFRRGMGNDANVLTLSRRIRELADEGWLVDLKSLEGEGDFLLPVVHEDLDTSATTDALDRIFAPDRPIYVKPYFVDAALTEPAYSLGDLAVINLSNSRDRALLHQQTGAPARAHFEQNAYKLITESSVVNELVHTTLIAQYGFDIDGSAEVPEYLKARVPVDSYNALQVHQFISDAASLAATRHAIWMMMHHVLAVSAEGVEYGVNRSNYQLSATWFSDGVVELAQERGIGIDLGEWGKTVRQKIGAVNGPQRERTFERLVGVYSNKVVALLGPDGIDELRDRHVAVARQLVDLIRMGNASARGSGATPEG